MLTQCKSYLDEDIRQWQWQNIERMEAECGHELAELSDATLAQRARRLLDLPISFFWDEFEFLQELLR